MSFEVREEVSAMFYQDIETTNIKENAEAVSLFQSVSSAVSPDSINVDIEGIHSTITKNFTYYTPECLKKSIPHWTSPYEKPVIMHHKDKDGMQIGRIKCVEFLEKSRAGMPGLLFTCNIGDESGIKGVQNGTLSTVSLGAIIHKAKCSICGQDIAAEGECEHRRGREYDGKLCYWIMEEMEPKELSYVIVPSDKYANTIKIYKPKKTTSKESFEEGDANTNMTFFKDIDLSMEQPEPKQEATESAAEETTETKEAEVVADVEVKDEEVKNEEPNNDKEEEVETKNEEEVETKQEDENKDKSKEELMDLVNAYKKQVDELLEDIAYLKSKLNKERGIKESLELEILTLKKNEKMHLVEQVCNLRKELGLKDEDPEELMMLSEESLNSSIKTFMEFKESNTFNVSKLPKIESQALVNEEQDNTTKEVTESINHQNLSNIDYEQDIDDWFKKMTHRKYF